MRASRHFPLGVLVVVLANILTTYASPTAFYFFDKENNNGVRMAFQYDQTTNEFSADKLPPYWNSHWPTCFLIHDYYENPAKAETSSILIKEALLKDQRECNIVIVDWHTDVEFDEIKTDWHQEPEGGYPPDDFNIVITSLAHFTAFTTNVPDTAYKVVHLIQWIREKVAEALGLEKGGGGEEVIAFAHGMGAQVIAYAAQVLLKRQQKEIETIIATDPPSQNREAENSSTLVQLNYISQKSAHRVIIINTNVGGFGSLSIGGHLVFVINNDYILIQKLTTDPPSPLDVKKGNVNIGKIVQVQPGFSKQKPGHETLFYSHNLAVEFLADQIVNPITLVCYGRQIALFGEDVVVESLPPNPFLIVLSWTDVLKVEDINHNKQANVHEVSTFKSTSDVTKDTAVVKTPLEEIE